MKCECGEEVSGDVCMLCGSEVRNGATGDSGAAEDGGPESAESAESVPDSTTPLAGRPPDESADGIGVAEAAPAVKPKDAARVLAAAEPNAPGRVPPDAGDAPVRRDSMRSGRLGGYMLDIEKSVRIMDKDGNQIYDIPYGGIECSNRLGALRMRYPGGSVSLRGSGGRAWRRAIEYQQSPPVWYLKGSDDCDVSYGDVSLGVTPCVVTPPFSWDAFQDGSYELRVSRPGTVSQKKTIRAASGTHSIRLPDGPAAERDGDRPEGERLVLNASRTLVLSDVPCLTDRRGVTVLRMPGASISVKFLKRGATIYWDEPGLGRLSVRVRCDTGLKYDRLREMLPPAKRNDGGPDAAPRAMPDIAPHAAAPEREEPRGEAPADGPDAAVPEPDGPDMSPYSVEPPEPTPKKKRKWWGWGRKPKGSKYNRGTYEGKDLCVTKADLDAKLGRLDGYSFEAATANLLAAMGYKIEKGYNVKSGRMIGQTKSDMGIDVLAVKGKERVIVQCKHWKGQCGGPDVNKTIGAASVFNGTSVLVVCTGGFTEQAMQVAEGSSMQVELWGWDTIRRNMRRHLL